VPKPQSEPQPQVRQPPRSESDEDDLLTPVELEESDEDDNGDPFVLPGWVWAIGLSLLIPAAIIFIPLIIIAAIKVRRARRRREAERGPDQVAGAWQEMLDQYAELGFDVPKRSTRLMIAERLEAQLADQPVRLRSLAAAADEAVFDGQEVDPERSEKVWNEALAATAVAREAVTRARRILSLYRIRRQRKRS